MRKRIKHIIVGEMQVTFISDADGKELLDTEVVIEGQTLCCIAGCDIDKFTVEIQSLVNKYRI